MPSFTGGNAPHRNDTRWTILQKILGATNDGGGGGSIQVIAGAVDDPNGTHEPADTTKGAMYYMQDSGSFSLWLWSPDDQFWFPAIQ